MDRATKDLFELLLTVSGVGPRVALALLDIGPAGELRTAISVGQTDYLTRAPGLGRRLADRLIVDLKDKVSGPVGPASLASVGPAIVDEAVAALIGLGLSPDEARQALIGVDASLPSTSRVQQALTGLNLS